MTTLVIGKPAPLFNLPDHSGSPIELALLLKNQHVLLVFNIGFI